MDVDPAALRIVRYPDPALRKRAEPVEIDQTVRAVALQMIELMYAAEGIGLAAPQVGLPWRLFVCHVPAAPGDEDGNDPPISCAEPQIHINPELTSPADGLEPLDEGCLSLPGISGEVRRPPAITITSTDLDGNRRETRAAGLLARCWQHEYDHLEGVLIIDKMPRMVRLKNRSAIRALEREAR